MTPSLPAAMGTSSSVGLAARAGLFAFGLLVAALAGAASADQPALAALLKTLDLRGYTSPTAPPQFSGRDRKSTRLNSSHGYISYAVFCLKKKKKTPFLHAQSTWPTAPPLRRIPS